MDRTPGAERGLRARASDAERERVVAALGAAAGEGRLTIDEADERIAAALQARFRGELDALTADLPDDRDRGRGRRPARRRPSPALVSVALLAVVFVAIAAATHGHAFFPVVPIVFLLLRFGVFTRPRPRRWV